MIPVDIDNFNINEIATFSSFSSYMGGNCVTIRKKINWIPREISNIQTLVNIDMSKGEIINISPLSKCNLLRSVCLNYNKIVDISPLAKCISLTNLYISDNEIVNISPLANCILLDVLNISNNKIVGDARSILKCLPLTYLFNGEYM